VCVSMCVCIREMVTQGHYSVYIYEGAGDIRTLQCIHILIILKPMSVKG